MPSFVSPLIYICIGVGPSTGARLVNRPGTTLLKETDFPALRSHQLSLSLSAKGEGLCVPSSGHTGMTGLTIEFTSAMTPWCPEDTVSPHLVPMSLHAGWVSSGDTVS